MMIGGKKVNNWILIGGLAAGAFVVYEIRKGGASPASAASSSSAIDPVTNLPYSMDSQTDPATGMTYLAEAQQYGSVAAAEAAVSGSGLYGSGAGSSYALDAGYPTIYPASQNPAGGQPGAYVNFAQWAQAATAGLTQLGYSATDVSAALGLYQAGMPLTTLSDGASSLSIVQAAVAEFGTPPGGPYPIVAPPTNSTPPPNQTPPPSSTPPPSTQPAVSQPAPGPFPTVQGVPFGQAQYEIAKAGWTVTNVTYQGQDVPQAQWSSYSGHPVYSATPYPSTGSVRIGLN